MASNLDILLIIDVECTCWGGPPPPDQRQEIIEIGLATFDTKAWKPLATHQLIIKPVLSTVSKYCTDLTGWTAADLAGGWTFSAACNVLTDVYNSHQRVWVSWGDFDRKQFELDCKRKAVNYPFGPGHINLKTIYALKQQLRRGVGMTTALKQCELKLEGAHHRGVDDAWNTARILAKIGR